MLEATNGIDGEFLRKFYCRTNESPDDYWRIYYELDLSNSHAIVTSLLKYYLKQQKPLKVMTADD